MIRRSGLTAEERVRVTGEEADAVVTAALANRTTVPDFMARIAQEVCASERAACAVNPPSDEHPNFACGLSAAAEPLLGHDSRGYITEVKVECQRPQGCLNPLLITAAINGVLEHLTTVVEQIEQPGSSSNVRNVLRFDDLADSD